jgi:integrase
MELVKNSSGNWSARYKDASGKKRSTNLRTKDKREAKSLCKSLRIEEIEQAGMLGILSREVIAKIVSGKDVKFSTVTEEWIEFKVLQAASGNTINSQSAILNQFMREFSHKDSGITAISPQDVFDFVNQDDGTSLANRSLRKSTLSAVFRYAAAKTYILTNPADDIRIDTGALSHEQKEKKERMPYTHGEFLAILDYAPYFFRQAVGISYWCGLRLGDICGLEWASIGNKHITVWTEKRDKRVRIPLGHELFGGDELKGILAEIDPIDDMYCFPVWHQNHIDPKKRAKVSMYYRRIVERLCSSNSRLSRTLYKDKVFHCHRHSFVTRLEKAGIDIAEIGKVVGHSNTATTLGYSH